jgi:hypothetical protein
MLRGVEAAPAKASRCFKAFSYHARKREDPSRGLRRSPPRPPLSTVFLLSSAKNPEQTLFSSMAPHGRVRAGPFFLPPPPEQRARQVSNLRRARQRRAQCDCGVMSKPLTPQELAAARIRGARYRARRRGSQLIRWDGRVGYDGVVLGMLVLRGYLTEADTADPAKVNAALTQVLFYEAYQEAPERIPRCFVRVEDRFDQCERLRRGRLFVGLFLVTWHSDPFALGSPKTLLQPCRGYGVNAPAGGRCHRAVRPGLFHRRSL